MYKNTILLQYDINTTFQISIKQPCDKAYQILAEIYKGLNKRYLYKSVKQMIVAYIFKPRAIISCSIGNRDLTLLEEGDLKNLCKQNLKAIAESDLVQLAKSLFPMQNSSNPHQLFYLNLSTFFTMRINKKIEFDQIIKEALKKAEEIGNHAHTTLSALFKTQFTQRFKKRIIKSKPTQINLITSDSPSSADNSERVIINFSKDKLQKQKQKYSNSPLSQTKSLPPNDSSKPVPLKAPLPQTRRQPLTVASNSPSTNTNLISQSGIVTNLSDQDMCFCGKHISLIQKSKQSYFHCYHCSKKYHTDCMKRSLDSKSCSFCHLRKLLPNRETKKTIFVGLLHKGQKRHEINFVLNQQDLSVQFKIQVRSFRIKQGCQTFVLFPDSANFSLRGVTIKQFTPLHKQSSLKYRKDEPFYLNNGLNCKDNKLIITQKLPTKQTRDQRIESTTHLFGIYVIQQKKVEWLIRQLRISGQNTFLQSKQLLTKSFKVGDDQISCELIKISLCCSLSIQKLKIPARGIFCNHFQCFDLKNFLDLTAGSSNPRWLCPICKLPAYQFKIDVILTAILEAYKAFDNASQIVFLKNGEFKIFSNDSKECNSPVRHINDLQIQERNKRVQALQQHKKPQPTPAQQTKKRRMIQKS